MTQTETAETSEQAAGHPRCPICFVDFTRFLFAPNGIPIYKCGRCGLEFQFPQPSDEQLAAIYSSGYFLGSTDAVSLDNQRALKRATARLYLDQLAARMPSTGRLLEIGCGHGEFLLEAQARGFEVEGLEYSSHAAREANAQLGPSAVRVGSPESDSLPPAAYDVVAAFDVIEHLRNPVRALELLHSALRPGGMVAIVTPSLDSWSRRLLGRYWMEYKVEHLTYFSRKSLRRMLDDAGFTDIRFAPNYKVLNLYYIAAHFQRFPVPILTRIVRMLNRVLPRRVRLQPFHVVASGLMATARRSAID
jgi:SAM-dependent methyltransferase